MIYKKQKYIDENIEVLLDDLDYIHMCAQRM